MSTRFDPDELRDLEHRLTERLEGIAPRPRPAAAERVRAEIAMTSQRRGLGSWLRARLPEPAWTRIATVGGVAVVALVVGIAIGTSGVFHVGKSPEPSPSGPVSSQPPFGESWQQVSVEPADTPGDYVVEGGYAGCRPAPCWSGRSPGRLPRRWGTPRRPPGTRTMTSPGIGRRSGSRACRPWRLTTSASCSHRRRSCTGSGRAACRCRTGAWRSPPSSTSRSTAGRPGRS